LAGNGARNLPVGLTQPEARHDIIDPSQADQQIDIVYPKLIELVSAQIEEMAEA
jgi:hypothetical protein